MYCDKSDEQTWLAYKENLGEKILQFFRIFSNKVGQLTLASFCKCTACTNVEQLKLKIVVHSGRAVLYQIGNFIELSGPDVIVVHRLLKNSVLSDEYILLTESAYADLAFPDELVERSRERYDDVGTIETYVYFPPEPEYSTPDPDAQAALPTIFVETLRSEIRAEYTEVATAPEKGFHFHTGRPLARLLGYHDKWLLGLPERSIESFAGTGNPFSLGRLRPGERIVDVGCGAGLDSLIAARMVGPTGRVIGVDMTPAMREKARTSAADLGLDNLEIREGYAEELPIPDEWADVIISNGVVNLCPDKQAVFREMYRVLKPDGRLQIGDILVQKPVPEAAKLDIDLWAG